MKKIFTSLLLLSFIASKAQNDKKDSTEKFHLFLGIGMNGQNFDNLNARIAGYPIYQQLPNYQANFTFGWVAETDRAIIDFQFGFGNSMSGDQEKKSSSISSFGGSALFGYAIAEQKSFRLYPFLGFGAEMFHATFNKDVSAVPFDSLLQNPSTQQKASSISFSNNYITYTAGIGIDFFNKKHRHKAIGFRGGYEGGFSSRDWRMNQNQILFNAPKDHLSRWFVGIQFMVQPKKRKGHW
jgi:hypothetical protein